MELVASSTTSSTALVASRAWSWSAVRRASSCVVRAQSQPASCEGPGPTRRQRQRQRGVTCRSPPPCPKNPNPNKPALEWLYGLPGSWVSHLELSAVRKPQGITKGPLPNGAHQPLKLKRGKRGERGSQPVRLRPPFRRSASRKKTTKQLRQRTERASWAIFLDSQNQTGKRSNRAQFCLSR